MKKILFIFGTRPEAIKMAPLILKFKQFTAEFKVTICITAQHREMLDQVLQFFKIQSNYDLNVMKPNQSLFMLTATILTELESVLNKTDPDIIFVQGDTTSAFVGALAGFYKKIKVAHLEAGLRSNNKFSPFPEEINRILAGHIADYHFAPTIAAQHHLLSENIQNNIFVVGNTVIDALLIAKTIIQEQNQNSYYDKFTDIDFSKKIILVTGHRRESFGQPFEHICIALKEIALERPDIQIVYPVHLNPNVKNIVHQILGNISNIKLINPIDYPDMVWLMQKSQIILTDSGGVQEEAPSLGKPVLVMRDVTERQEGIDAGTAKLVGTDKEVIKSSVFTLLDNQEAYDKMASAINPYGDGDTSTKIMDIISNL